MSTYHTFTTSDGTTASIDQWTEMYQMYQDAWGNWHMQRINAPVPPLKSALNAAEQRAAMAWRKRWLEAQQDESVNLAELLNNIREVSLMSISQARRGLWRDAVMTGNNLDPEIV